MSDQTQNGASPLSCFEELVVKGVCKSVFVNCEHYSDVIKINNNYVVFMSKTFFTAFVTSIPPGMKRLDITVFAFSIAIVVSLIVNFLSKEKELSKIIKLYHEDQKDISNQLIPMYIISVILVAFSAFIGFMYGVILSNCNIVIITPILYAFILCFTFFGLWVWCSNLGKNGNNPATLKAVVLVAVFMHRIFVIWFRLFHLAWWYRERGTLGWPVLTPDDGFEEPTKCPVCGSLSLRNWPRMDRPWIECCANTHPHLTFLPLTKTGKRSDGVTAGRRGRRMAIVAYTPPYPALARLGVNSSGVAAFSVSGAPAPVSVAVEGRSVDDGRFWAGDYDVVAFVLPSEAPANPLARWMDDLRGLVQLVSFPAGEVLRPSIITRVMRHPVVLPAWIDRRSWLARPLRAVAALTRLILYDPAPMKYEAWRNASLPRLAVVVPPGSGFSLPKEPDWLYGRMEVLASIEEVAGLISPPQPADGGAAASSPSSSTGHGSTSGAEMPAS